MKILLITFLIIYCLLFITIGLSILVLKYLKGTNLYHFIKRHLITDEDLEN